MFIGLAAAALLVGCATPYQSRGFQGGFDETQISPNTFRIIFAGNPHTSPERVQDMALLRSADIGSQNGFTHFVLTSEKTAVQRNSFALPSTSTTQLSGNNYGNFSGNTSGGVTSGNFDNNFRGTATTTTSPGAVIREERYGAMNMVVYFNSQPNAATWYSVQFICKSLGKKYEVKCGEPPAGSSSLATQPMTAAPASAAPSGAAQ